MTETERVITVDLTCDDLWVQLRGQVILRVDLAVAGTQARVDGLIAALSACGTAKVQYPSDWVRRIG